MVHLQIIHFDRNPNLWVAEIVESLVGWPEMQAPPYARQTPAGEVLVTLSMPGVTVDYQGEKLLAVFGTISDTTGTVEHLKFTGVLIGYSFLPRASRDPRSPAWRFGAN